MSSQEESASKKERGGKKVILGIVIALVIVILIGVIAYLLIIMNRSGDAEEKRNVVVTSDNVEEVVENMLNAEPVRSGYYTVTMNNEWYFADGSSTSENAYVENLTENTNDVYFDVFLADDEEHAIYKSPVIPRGYSLESIALDEALEKGTYDCVMIYHLVDEEQNTLSTLRVGFTIIIEN